MSAEVAPYSEAQAKQSGEEVQAGEIAEEDVEVCYKEKEPEESRGRERPLSLDHVGMKDVTSGVLEQFQNEETHTYHERKKLSHLNIIRERQDRGSGACQVKQYFLKSFTRSFKTRSYRDREQHEEEPRGPGPFYFIGGGNGAEIVSSYCESKGWKRIFDRHRKDYKLKWCQTKSPGNYSNFREGEQLVYQIPNNRVLTTKIGLLSSLQEYERVCSKVKHGPALRRLKIEAFIPTTFRMDVREERDSFFDQQDGVNIWICKPTDLNQGKGIFLLKNRDDVIAFKQKLQLIEDRQVKRKLHYRCVYVRETVQCEKQLSSFSLPKLLVLNQPHLSNCSYIQNPLLLKGKKFDVRSYLLIACTSPYMVFFRHGYVRLTCDLYDPGSNNLSAHLTNQYMQKKNPLYSQVKEDTVWSMESFNAYVNDKFQVAKGLPRDWVLGTFAKRMQKIMTHCFLAVKSKLHSQLGFFDLIGCDFLVDEDFKVWLLEMNCNPALHTNCEVLKEVIPCTVVETLDLTLEIFNKCRLKQKILPLASQREFVLLYNGIVPSNLTAAQRKSTTDGELHQKLIKKMQKTDGPRQWKLETKGKNVLFGSSVHLVNVSVIGEQSFPLRAGHRRSMFMETSALHENPAHGSSHLHGSNNRTQSVRRKNPRPPVELKLSKCILHHNVKAADPKRIKTRRTRILRSRSSSAVRERTSACDYPETVTLPPHVKRLCR